MKTHRPKHERSLDAEMIRFVLFFGLPFVTAPSVLGVVTLGIVIAAVLAVSKSVLTFVLNRIWRSTQAPSRRRSTSI